MSLRDTVRKLFAKPKETPKTAWQGTTSTLEDRTIAAGERAQQLREFDQRKAAAHSEDLNEQRRLAALQHAKLNLIPPGATELQAKALIERRATEALDRKNQLERGEIERKPVHRLVVDARAREAREGSNRLPPRDKEGDRAAENQQASADQQSLIEMRAREPALEPEPVTEAYIKQVMDAQARHDREAESRLTPHHHAVGRDLGKEDAGHSPVEMKERYSPPGAFEQVAELEPMEMTVAGPSAEAEAQSGPMTSEERVARIEAAREAAAAQALEADHELDPGREM